MDQDLVRKRRQVLQGIDDLFRRFCRENSINIDLNVGLIADDLNPEIEGFRLDGVQRHCGIVTQGFLTYNGELVRYVDRHESPVYVSMQDKEISIVIMDSVATAYKAHPAVSDYIIPELKKIHPDKNINMFRTEFNRQAADRGCFEDSLELISKLQLPVSQDGDSTYGDLLIQNFKDLTPDSDGTIKITEENFTQKADVALIGLFLTHTEIYGLFNRLIHNRPEVLEQENLMIPYIYATYDDEKIPLLIKQKPLPRLINNKYLKHYKPIKELKKIIKRLQKRLQLTKGSGDMQKIKKLEDSIVEFKEFLLEDITSLLPKEELIPTSEQLKEYLFKTRDFYKHYRVWNYITNGKKTLVRETEKSEELFLEPIRSDQRTHIVAQDTKAAMTLTQDQNFTQKVTEISTQPLQSESVSV